MPRSEIASHKSSHLILLDGVCSVVERLGFFPKSRRGSRVCIQTAHSKRPTGGGILIPSPSWEGIDILHESRMLNPAAIYAAHSEDLSPFSLWEKGRG